MMYFIAKNVLSYGRTVELCQCTLRLGINFSCAPDQRCEVLMEQRIKERMTTAWLKKSKRLILAVNEIFASQTRVSFAKLSQN